MFEDQHDLIIMCTGCTLLAVHLAMLLPRVMQVRRINFREIKPLVMIRSLWAWVRAEHMDKNHPHYEEVERLVTERRLTMSKVMYQYFTWIFVFIECIVLANILTDTPRFLTHGLDWVVVVVLFLSTAIKVHPPEFTAKTLDALYSVFMLVHCVAMIPPVVYKEAVPSLSNSMMPIRLLAGLSTLNIPIVIFWNFAYLSTTVVSYQFGYSDCTWMPYTSTYATSEFCGMTCSVGLLIAMKASMYKQARQEVEASSARSETSAVSALLSTMGDAVVELDRNLRIVGESTQLATMLLQGPRRSLKGMPFEQLLASRDDVQIFQEYMAKEVAPDQSLADVFHVKVRDMLNNNVRVEVFHVCKKGLCVGSIDHLLGIREDTEFEREDGIQAAGVMAEPEFIQPSLSATAGPGISISSNENMILLSALTFEILQVSASFIALLGQRPANDNFYEWLSDTNRTNFTKHFKSKLNKWMAAKNSSASVVRITYKNMNLKIPLSSHSFLRLTTTCTMVLSMQHNLGSGPEERGPVAEAIFTDLNMDPHAKNKKSRRQGENGTSSASESGSLAGSDSDKSGRRQKPSTPKNTAKKRPEAAEFGQPDASMIGKSSGPLRSSARASAMVGL